MNCIKITTTCRINTFHNPLKLFLFSVLFLCSFASWADNWQRLKFVGGNELTVIGHSEVANNNRYQRIDSVLTHELPARVRYLSSNSSGIQIMFQTISRRIDMKWNLRDYISRPSMAPVAVNGLDLYGWNGTRWQFVSSAMPKSKINSATIIKNLEGQMRHYRIYLPLYAELTDSEIGVDETAAIQCADPAYIPDPRVVFYGSSITQGAAAIRPGMSYPSLLGRDLNTEVINLGFSGSGKMEIQVADILAQIDADLYVLDCVPNPSPQQIKQRALLFISRLRQLKPDIPMLMVESVFHETGYWNSEMWAHVTQQNETFRRVYQQLKKDNPQLLHYLPCDNLLGNSRDVIIDGTHQNDVSNLHLSEAMGNKIKNLLGL